MFEIARRIKISEHDDQGKSAMANEVYYRAKTWQLALFALNRSATYCPLFLIMYMSYYATGVAGLSVVAVGLVPTVSLLLDVVVNPVVGVWMDRTCGKFGKYRPFMVLGNVICSATVFLIFCATHLVPEPFRLAHYVVWYLVYIIGYTLQTSCSNAGQTCLTNDPVQRPLLTLFDTVWGTVLYTVFRVIGSGPLYDWAGGFTEGYFGALSAISAIASAVLTLLAVIGIWEHDRHEFFGEGEQHGEKVAFRDYGDVLKTNGALRAYLASYTSASLAINIKSTSIITVVLFGILYGDYSMYGTAGSIVTIPCILVSLLGTRYAVKKGLKKTLAQFTAYELFVLAVMAAAAVCAYLHGSTLKSMGALGVVFMIAYVVMYCVESMSASVFAPMIADCSDYEAALSGRRMSGMISSMVSFIGKILTALSTTVTSIALAAIGFTNVQPAAEDPMTQSLFVFLFILYFLLPILGWLGSLVAMRKYPLTKEKMAEIQQELALKKA